MVTFVGCTVGFSFNRGNRYEAKNTPQKEKKFLFEVFLRMALSLVSHETPLISRSPPTFFSHLVCSLFWLPCNPHRSQFTISPIHAPGLGPCVANLIPFLVDVHHRSVHVKRFCECLASTRPLRGSRAGRGFLYSQTAWKPQTLGMCPLQWLPPGCSTFAT